MAVKFTQVVDFTNQRLTNVASPSVGTDGVNKSYVDAVGQGLSWKQAVRAASTGNINLASPGATIDGVLMANGDRWLAKNQTVASENGFYVFNGAASGATRTTDANTAGKLVPGSAASVAEGTVNGDRSYLLITDAPITLDTTALAFTLMTGGSGNIYTAGNGLGLTGMQFAVTAAPGGGVIVAAGGVSVDASIFPRKFAANVGDGSSTNITVNHALATQDVTVQVFTNNAPYDTIFCEVQRTDANNVALLFGSAPSAAQYRVVVMG